MKTMRFFGMIGVLGLLVPYAWAGKEIGNGGGAWICANPAHNQLIDLWEAEILGLRIQRSDAPVEDQIRQALDRLSAIDPELGKLTASWVGVNSLRRRALPSSASIPAPTDVNNDFLKRDCEIAGAAVYKDASETLWFDQSIVGTLSNTDQAALWVHEAIYKVLRFFPKTADSRDARLYVGYLFSDMPAQALAKVKLTRLVAEGFSTYPDGSVRAGRARLVNSVGFQGTPTDIYVTIDFDSPEGKRRCKAVAFDIDGALQECTPLGYREKSHHDFGGRAWPARAYPSGFKRE